MRVLMISLDRGFFDRQHGGDVVARHKKYADLAGSLDIIVFASADFERAELGHNLHVVPTRSKKRDHFSNAVTIALKLAGQTQYDLLVTQEFAAPAGAKIKKVLDIPWVVNIHSMFFSQKWLKLSPVHWYLFYRIKKAIGEADGFRVNNEVIRKRLEDWGIKKPILVQATPIDVKKFSKVRPLPNPPLARGGGKIVTLYVGRLAPEKNVGMLIRAFRAVIARTPSALGGRGTKQSLDHEIATARQVVPRNDVLLWIVGAGPEEQKLKSLVGEDAQIKFLGQKTHEELILIYQEADIFVLPSNTESFGKVLIEAGAAGCAIIATKTTGAMSILEHGKTGLLVDVGDEKGLTEGLQRLVSDKELRMRLSQGAQEMVKKYDEEEGVKRTVEFWKEIVKGR